MHFLSSLKSQTILLVISAMVIGATATAVWVQSVSNWNRHLEHSYLTGLALHDTLRDGAKIPDGLAITQLNGVDARLAPPGCLKNYLMSALTTRLLNCHSPPPHRTAK